jgi:dTDP-4-dehydrorhamnose reductase
MKEGHQRSTPPLQLWGGVECTVVRIGDHFRDQIVETRHSVRLKDLDAIAELGIRTVRYPIVWERVAPDIPTASTSPGTTSGCGGFATLASG